MQPLPAIDGPPRLFRGENGAVTTSSDPAQWNQLVGPVTLSRRPQVLFADEDLEQARRQLVLYGRDGLPVLSHDGRLQGWLTRADILKALTTKLKTGAGIQRGAAAIEQTARLVPTAGPTPTRPLPGFELLELRVNADSPARGRRIGDV